MEPRERALLKGNIDPVVEKAASLDRRVAVTAARALELTAQSRDLLGQTVALPFSCNAQLSFLDAGRCLAGQGYLRLETRGDFLAASRLRRDAPGSFSGTVGIGHHARRRFPGAGRLHFVGQQQR